MDEKKNEPEIKIDLKHDSMDFSAATEEGDILDTDDETFEPGDISAEELVMLEDDPEVEAAALEAVAEDSITDDRNLPDEDWTDDLPDTEEDNEEFPNR